LTNNYNFDSLCDIDYHLEKGALMKTPIIFSLLFAILLLSACSSSETNNKKTIAVSIVPEAEFIKKIVADKLDVVILIPPGSSPATHQPSPKDLQKLEESDLYFSIGVQTEISNILPIIKDSKTLKIIDLANKVNTIYSPRYFDTNKTSTDPHIWLSPKRVIEIVKIMKIELIKQYPENKKFFSSNADAYILELENLDSYIKNKVNSLENKNFIIYHPSYGYFADDYGLNMIAIESDGKNASINRLNKLIEIAENSNIKTIYYQSEMSSKQAKIIASEINGNVIQIEPLSLNYIENQKLLIDTMVGE
jgi:zinc transport system substrate-binding protein